MPDFSEYFPKAIPFFEYLESKGGFAAEDELPDELMISEDLLAICKDKAFVEDRLSGAVDQKDAASAKEKIPQRIRVFHLLEDGRMILRKWQEKKRKPPADVVVFDPFSRDLKELVDLRPIDEIPLYPAVIEMLRIFKKNRWREYDTKDVTLSDADMADMKKISDAAPLCLYYGLVKGSTDKKTSRFLTTLRGQAYFAKHQEEVSRNEAKGEHTTTPGEKKGKKRRKRGEEPTKQVGVTLREVAEILQQCDPENTEKMLKRWNKVRIKKPLSVGERPSDHRAKLYEPTAIADWAEKVENYLTMPKSDLIKRLMRLAVSPSEK